MQTEFFAVQFYINYSFSTKFGYQCIQAEQLMSSTVYIQICLASKIINDSFHILYEISNQILNKKEIDRHCTKKQTIQFTF